MDLAGGGQSTSKSTCEVPAWTLTAFGGNDLHPACPNRGRLELWPGNDSFCDKSVKLSMLIDLLTSTCRSTQVKIASTDQLLTSTMSCRSTQVKIASTDLWPQEMFTFSEMLALVESGSSFGAYVCHSRSGGYRATSHLVRCMSSWSLWGAEQMSACG